MKVVSDRGFPGINPSHGVENAVFLLRVPNCVPKSLKKTPVSLREIRRAHPFIRTIIVNIRIPSRHPHSIRCRQTTKSSPSHQPIPIH